MKQIYIKKDISCKQAYGTAAQDPLGAVQAMSLTREIAVTEQERKGEKRVMLERH
jgi:hypothetical protein